MHGHTDTTSYFSLRLDFTCEPEELSRWENYRSSWQYRLEHHEIAAKLSVSLLSIEPITVYQNPFLNRDVLSALTAVETTTGRTIYCPDERPGRRSVGGLGFYSWQHRRELGVRRRHQGPRGSWRDVETFQPGELSRLRIQDMFHTTLWSPCSESLRDGERYTLKLDDDIAVPMWTFGTLEGGLKGPFNLPPMPVTLEGQTEFIYRAPTSNARARFEPC
jgi:hypothetical protein